MGRGRILQWAQSEMRSPNRTRLTDAIVRQLEPPREGDITYWDTEVPGFGVRCIPSGAKAYIVTYRAGYGRAGTARRVTIGKVGAYRLRDARDAALDIRARVLKGHDPVLEMRAAARAARIPELALSEALDRYEADQERRGVVARAKVMSCLRNHLLKFTEDMPLAEVSRRTVVEAIEALERDGLHGAAADLRSRASTFLKWSNDRGYIAENPLRDYRASRATRAQRLAQRGRELSEEELRLVWHACASEGTHPAYGALVRTLILTGQRRTETSRMLWSALSSDMCTWRIPASETKNGVDHDVPITPLLGQLLRDCRRRVDCDYVFTTNWLGPISGWSKLDRNLRQSVNAGGEVPHWTLHDLRRTFRSGLTRLGVDQDVAEIMLNHRPATLRAVYDRDPRMNDRREAAERWALHVQAVVNPEGQKNVVAMRGGAV